MTPKELKRFARRKQLEATILSDGSRSYFIELQTERGSRMLCSPHGKPLAFPSLSQAQRLLARCQVTDVVLKTRIAAAEACADAAMVDIQFSTLRLSSPTKG